MVMSVPLEKKESEQWSDENFNRSSGTATYKLHKVSESLMFTYNTEIMPILQKYLTDLGWFIHMPSTVSGIHYILIMFMLYLEMNSIANSYWEFFKVEQWNKGTLTGTELPLIFSACF